MAYSETDKDLDELAALSNALGSAVTHLTEKALVADSTRQADSLATAALEEAHRQYEQAAADYMAHLEKVNLGANFPKAIKASR